MIALQSGLVFSAPAPAILWTRQEAGRRQPLRYGKMMSTTPHPVDGER